MNKNRSFMICNTVWITVLVLWASTPGESLRCYVCNSIDDDNCFDPIGEEYLRDCGGPTAADDSTDMDTNRTDMIHGAQNDSAMIHGAQNRTTMIHGAQNRTTMIHGTQDPTEMKQMDMNHMERKHTNCRKQTYTVESTAYDWKEDRIVRSCGYTRHHKYDCFFSSTKDLKSTTCECEEDGCNTGQNISGNISMLSSLLMFALLSIT